MMRQLACTSVIIVLLTVAACSLPRPPLPYDASNPLKRVAVLPVKNDTADVDGPDVIRGKMVQALERRSYVVKDTKETDQILRDQMGITLGGQLDMTTAQKLGEALGVEGVLYGTLMDFDEMTTGAVNVKKVRGKFELVNTMTGQILWSRGLGVRSEMMMQSKVGAAATIAAKAADVRDKDVPWVTIEHTTTGSNNLGKSFAVGLGIKLISKALGIHLDRESTELAKKVTEDLPWGPGSSAAATVPDPKFPLPEIKMPAPPSFGYMEWVGKKDFSAVVFFTSFGKNKNEPLSMEIPMAIAGNKMRRVMDLSKMLTGEPPSPLSKMVVLDRGDKNLSYTLYPNAQKYMVHTGKETAEEKPKIEKTKLGSEMIGKYRTDKYQVKITYLDGKVDEGFIWNALELDGMTIKSEVESKDYRIISELKNIVLKTPSDSLFEIPIEYTEAKSFTDLMAAVSKK